MEIAFFTNTNSQRKHSETNSLFTELMQSVSVPVSCRTLSRIISRCYCRNKLERDHVKTRGYLLINRQLINTHALQRKNKTAYNLLFCALITGITHCTNDIVQTITIRNSAIQCYCVTKPIISTSEKTEITQQNSAMVYRF
jgi:hypothetical protein